MGPKNFSTPFEAVNPTTNRIASLALDGAFRVHRALGPGLLENTYEACLAYELGRLGLNFQRQVEIPLVYEDVRLDVGFRLDLWVEGMVILEIKAVDQFLPIHTAQLITYLKLVDNQLGYLINFNVRLLKDGLKRIVL